MAGVIVAAPSLAAAAASVDLCFPTAPMPCSNGRGGGRGATAPKSANLRHCGPCVGEVVGGWLGRKQQPNIPLIFIYLASQIQSLL